MKEQDLSSERKALSEIAKGRVSYAMLAKEHKVDENLILDEIECLINIVATLKTSHDQETNNAKYLRRIRKIINRHLGE
jgi:hypothetical protein